jgi:hypothetical protein
MTSSPHIAEADRATVRQVTVEELLDQTERISHVEALAALAGAPAGVAELAFNAFPHGTRMWVVTYGLATEDGDGGLTITDRGRQAIELAAERCSQPYRDVSLEDVMASTQEAIGRIVEQSGIRVREPATHPARAETAASSISRGGRHLVARLQSSLIDGVESSLAHLKTRGAAKQTANAEQGGRAPEDNDHQHTGAVH